MVYYDLPEILLKRDCFFNLKIRCDSSRFRGETVRLNSSARIHWGLSLYLCMHMLLKLCLQETSGVFYLPLLHVHSLALVKQGTPVVPFTVPSQTTFGCSRRAFLASSLNISHWCIGLDSRLPRPSRVDLCTPGGPRIEGLLTRTLAYQIIVPFERYLGLIERNALRLPSSAPDAMPRTPGTGWLEILWSFNRVSTDLDTFSTLNDEESS